MKKNRILIFWIGVISLFLSVCGQANAAVPLGDAFQDMGSSDLSATKAEATAQTSSLTWPKYPSDPSSVPAYEKIEGYFIPTSNSTKVAVFSDDGADVTVNGTKIHSQSGQGQALPKLEQSFHELSYTWEAGKIYHVEIDFSNIAHSDNTDVDGLTLFAYDGGGSVADVAEISVKCIDSQEGAPDGVSGLNIDTAGSGKVTFSVALNGGTAKNIEFTPSIVHPEGISGDAIKMLLDHNFAIGDSFHYSLTMTVAIGGILDKVGNEFDIDGDSTNGSQRTSTFKFHLEETGDEVTVVYEDE